MNDLAGTNGLIERSSKTTVLSRATYTVAEAMQAVNTWSNLTDQRRKDLRSALSAAPKAARLAPELVDLAPDRLRVLLLRKAPATVGVSDSRLKNLKCALRYVMRRLDLIDDPKAMQLSYSWRTALDSLEEEQPGGLLGLQCLGRCCSAWRVEPSELDAAVFADFAENLQARTLTPNVAKSINVIRRAWNDACQRPGWPGRPVKSPDRVSDYILPAAAFPQSFQDDLERWAIRMARTPLDFDPLSENCDLDGPPRALQPSTIQTRLQHLRWAASAMVAKGVPIEAITDLVALVTPLSRATCAIRFCWDRAGGVRSPAAGHVAEVLRAVARYDAKLPQTSINSLRQRVKQVGRQYGGMTPANETMLRSATEPGRAMRLKTIPGALIKRAMALRKDSARKARSLALRALAILILTYHPIRLANLCALRVDRHLQRAAGHRGPITHLVIPEAETKNRQALVFPVTPRLASLIETWLKYFQPVNGVASPFLFPGERAGHITPQAMREAIADTTEMLAGIRLTPHQFRHLAGKRYLDARPGHLEAVRLLLGHKSPITTARYYVSASQEQSARQFHEILERGLPPMPRKPRR